MMKQGFDFKSAAIRYEAEYGKERANCILLAVSWQFDTERYKYDEWFNLRRSSEYV